MDGIGEFEEFEGLVPGPVKEGLRVEAGDSGKAMAESSLYCILVI